jgi:hypothetical protein
MNDNELNLNCTSYIRGFIFLQRSEPRGVWGGKEGHFL